MNATLRITDGTTYVDLITGAYHLNDWSPLISKAKDGGQYTDSPMADGRRLVSYHWDNVEETLTLQLNAPCQDSAIEFTQTLRRLLVKAADYWAEDEQDTPVYIQCRAPDETNTRYAYIVKGDFESDANYFGQPFTAIDWQGNAVMDELPLLVERLHWQSDVPGTGTALSMSTTHRYDYSTWTLVDTLGAGDWDVVDQLTCADDNNHIYALDSGDVYRSVDYGDNWALRYNYAGTSYSIASAPNGDLWLGGVNVGGQSEVLKSTDDGLTFNAQDALVTHDRVFNIRVIDNNNILAWHYDAGGVDVSLLRHTANAGGAWNTVITAPSKHHGFSASIGAHAVAIVATVPWLTYYTSSDSGITWIPGFQTMVNPLNVIGVPNSSGTFIIPATGSSRGAGLSSWGAVFISYDYGVTWTYFDQTSIFPIRNIVFDSNDVMYGIAEGNIGVGYLPTVYTSQDGVVWDYEFEVGNGVDATPADIVSTPDDHVTVVETEDSWLRDDTYTFGQEEGTDNHYISNMFRNHNLTHIKVFENGVGYTDVIGTFPYDLFPDPINALDAVYFGFAAATTENPWQSLVFDLSVIMTADSYTIDWEYWVAAWTALNVVDNTGYSTSGFGYLGVNSVHWQVPSNWDVTVVDGISAFWVRAEISAINAPTDVPRQQTRDVYSISYPYVDIADDNVTGDIKAIALSKLENVSDTFGPVISAAPNLYYNNMMIGGRSLTRGASFAAYLNVSQRQNIPAVLVTTGDATTIAGGSFAPVGYRGVYNPTGLDDWQDRITFTLATGSSIDFVGVYHAYMRCQEYDATNDPGNISVRLKISAGHGGIEYITAEQQCTTVNDYVVLDFGRVTIPATNLLRSTQNVERSTIVIQCKAESNETDLYMYDLVLMPTDEMVVIGSTNSNNPYSFVWGNYGLVVDSVKGKPTLRAFLEDDTSIVRMTYATDGAALLLAPNVDQRLWFFAKSFFVVHAVDDSAVNDKAYLDDSTGDFLREGVKEGQTIVNVTDGSSGIITTVTADLIYATLSGTIGGGNDFDNGDVCYIVTDNIVSPPEICHQLTVQSVSRYLGARGEN